ncbi:hypothetical protein ACIQ7Q_34380 [Streptomyces sp. NPDC096176]|uniref:hypothetical protein n=1 Tax=Streptomyces sp. NPDC096176 TaxID=3366079 RepID=UPI0037FE1609
MDGELITAIAATAVSAGAAGVAFWQAHIAKGAARSAEAQVRAAEAQVQSAEAQVRSAETQVALMLRQVQGEEADRAEARGPQFTIEKGYTDASDANVPRGVLALRQTSGPALRSVIVSATGEGVEGMRGARNASSPWGYDRMASLDIGPMAAGGTVTVYVDLNFDTHETRVLFHLECQAQTGSDVWQRAVAQWIEPPPTTTRIGYSFRR